ncbi:MAG: protein-S-isoprenylcysteine O-methyltransferase Ste14 [Gammaproteobacteria bacterium]
MIGFPILRRFFAIWNCTEGFLHDKTYICRMALIEEFDKSGNWLFRWRSFLPLALYLLAAIIIFNGLDTIDHTDPYWIGTCLAISMFGLLIRSITIGYTPRGTSGRNTKEGQVAEVLNTKGIYSVCRHPLYLGNFFMWIGIIMYVGNWWFTIVCSLLFWLYYERIMFAEEYFLRNKFGHSYLDWSKSTPAFWPNLLKWNSGGTRFSMRNVLKREYSGFFATFLSFALLDVLKNYLIYDTMKLEVLVQPFWMWSAIGSLVVFISLRTLKKTTSILDVEGREYI